LTRESEIKFTLKLYDVIYGQPLSYKCLREQSTLGHIIPNFQKLHLAADFDVLPWCSYCFTHHYSSHHR